MQIGKVLSVLLILIIPATALATFPINSNWDSISNGWSCVNRTKTNLTADHYMIDCSSSTPNPSCSLKIIFPEGWPAGGEPYHCWNQFGSAKNEIYGQFYFKWSSGYTWNGVVNKLVYITPGPGATAAGDVLGVVNQKLQFRSQYAEVTNRSCNTGYNPTINTNQWYKVTWHGIVNTPGESNGVMKVWIDDTLAMDYNNVKWLGSDDAGKGFYELSITPVYGGGNTSGPTKTKDEYLWIDQTIVQSYPIGNVGSPPNSKIPDFPQIININ